jgi:signal transduction histidine kinase
MRQLKAIFWLVILFLPAQAAQAQTKTLDSLRAALHQRGKNSDKVLFDFYFEKARYLEQHQRDSSAYYLEQARRLAGKIKYWKGLAEYFHFFTASCNRAGKYDSAMQTGRKELYYAVRSEDSLQIAQAYNSLGNVHLNKGNSDSAAFYFLEAVTRFDRMDNKKLAAKARYNLSSAYFGLGDNDLSMRYAKEAYQIAIRIKDTHAMANSMLNRAVIEVKRGNNDTALKLFEQVRQMVQHAADSMTVMDVLNNVGEVLCSMNRFPEAIVKYREMLRLAKVYNSSEYLMYAYGNLGNTFLRMRRFRDAEPNLAQSVRIAKKLGSKWVLLQMYIAYAELKEKTKDYVAALNYRKQAEALKDSITNQQTRQHVEQLEIQYQTARKDRSIAEQKLALEKKQGDIRKKNTLSSGLALGCLLLIIIIILVYRNLTHRHNLLRKEDELHTQKIAELEKQRKLVAVQSVLEGEEQERSRLARDLHDGVGGLLSGVKLSLSTMKGNVFISEKNVQAIGQVMGQLDQSIAELRRVSHNMMPETLVRFGLKEALENYCENLNLIGKIQVQLQTYGMEVRMDQNSEIVLYRIVQELLNNIVKHAMAQHALIQLMRTDHRFTLTVEDDGQGFDLHAAEESGGAGLNNLRARVEYLDGIIDINTKPGSGTSVNIEGRCGNNE